ILKALKAQSSVSNIYFNDPDLIAENLCSALGGHDNHIHFEVKPPARGAIKRHDLKHYHSGGRLYQGSYQDDIDYRSYGLDAACGNTKGLGKNQTFIEFKEMKIASDLPSAREKNVFLRWNDIPANACEIDVVLHFHGFDIRNKKDRSFFDYAVNLSGLELKDRKRATLCILPFGKNEPKYKEWKDGELVEKVNYDRYIFPFLESDGGLQRLIDESLKALKINFTVGRLILAAHSGGGRTVADILRRKFKNTLKLTKANNDIDEVHLLDATYGGANDFINWAEKRIQFDSALDKSDLETKGGGLRVLYLPLSTNRDGKCVTTGTSAVSKAIEQKLIEFTKQKEYLRRCYRVETVGIKHLDIPNVFSPQLLRKGYTDLKVLQEHSSSVDACCNNNPKCGIMMPVQQQGLAYYDEDEVDYFADPEASYLNF
ncbi:MAG: hypothetical protein H7070_06040, partial [Saprospiraceae bacterium]|nr:hypothetical protein [Pyrinomonadaceae bacterium]